MTRLQFAFYAVREFVLLRESVGSKSSRLAIRLLHCLAKASQLNGLAISGSRRALSAGRRTLSRFGISRFALDERTPHRDLYLSPNHAVYIDGVLVPAKYLVNGRSIAQCAPEGAAIIEYLHIELFAHDVIYAEGATAETFGSVREARDHFDNFAEYYRLYSSERRLRLIHVPHSSGDSRGSTGCCGPCAVHWSRGWTRAQEWTK